ncbi:apolipoprotein N-acyltransferase [Microbacterium dauci]|uniref:Apolipoprotein N-acyltransferase n=1 Tax=Microbacterium dauci TaxID=3048008 RepID=A0ABT6ZC12_9MICO|nr:apolipoprotein N-acyltransferase [Microbacterium sp. LX3-4]MDJ1113697.1 apolipoprotein N-acyltransferase [Microbacterium sp. LX3-4]
MSRPGPAPLLPIWLALPIAIIAGALFDLAFPDVGIWQLAFPAAALALLTLIGRSVGGGMLVGAVFSASFYLLHIEWITRYLGVIPWFALAGIETLLNAITAPLLVLAYRWMPRLAPGPWVRVLALPALIAALWTAREQFLGSWPYTGFPWGRVGMSQSEGPLAELASWVGVSGLTFAMVFVAAAAIEATRLRVWRRLTLGIPAAAMLLILAVIPQFPTADAGTMRVGAVQGNGPSGYFDEREPYAIFQAQLDATAPVLDADIDLLLWPEGGIDADPLANTSVARALGDLATRVDAPLLVNAATERGEDIYNTSMLWNPGALEPSALHDKRNPVPMGEYVPDRWFFEAIVPDLIGLIQREYTPGTNAPFMDVDGVGVGLAICFDVIYDEVIRESVQDGAQVLMFQTNNADFRGTDENLQQLGFARMRAIETGRAVVNVSTVGTSQVIAPDGSVMDALGVDEAGALVVDVPLRTGLTAGVVLGPAVQWLLGWLSLPVLAALGVILRLRGRTKAAPPAEDGAAEV